MTLQQPKGDGSMQPTRGREAKAATCAALESRTDAAAENIRGTLDSGKDRREPGARDWGDRQLAEMRTVRVASNERRNRS